jgi:hypothetical protein
MNPDGIFYTCPDQPMWKSNEMAKIIQLGASSFVLFASFCLDNETKGGEMGGACSDSLFLNASLFVMYRADQLKCLADRWPNLIRIGDLPSFF